MLSGEATDFLIALDGVFSDEGFSVAEWSELSALLAETFAPPADVTAPQPEAPDKKSKRRKAQTEQPSAALEPPEPFRLPDLGVLWKELLRNACIEKKFDDGAQVCFRITDKGKITAQEVGAMRKSAAAGAAAVHTDELGRTVMVIDKPSEVAVKDAVRPAKSVKNFLTGLLGGFIGGLIAGAAVLLAHIFIGG